MKTNTIISPFLTVNFRGSFLSPYKEMTNMLLIPYSGLLHPAGFYWFDNNNLIGCSKNVPHQRNIEMIKTELRKRIVR